tara:strand:- start:1351 stop:2028 length:678 start_codon:yes stop_codon:yes gene_type:complete
MSTIENTKIKSELILTNDENFENFETIPLIKTSNSNTGGKLTPEQKKLLKGYKDKSFIVSILAKRSYEFFSTIKSFVNVPLILSSTSLAILNSASLTGEQMKIPNIIINSITGLTLAMISNFKITEKVTVFKNVSSKMNKLNHRIEEAIINDIDTNLNKDKMLIFIKEYEALVESLDYQFPTSIKKKVYFKYKDSGLKLPNALIGFDDIAITDLNANNFNGLDSV